MTSDGISTEDWDRVHEFALEVVNADDEADEERARRQLIACLDDLAVKYGELPSIYATKADYVDQPADSERLLLRAFDLAIDRNDSANLRLISFSLANHHILELLVNAVACTIRLRTAEITFVSKRIPQRTSALSPSNAGKRSGRFHFFGATSFSSP